MSSVFKNESVMSPDFLPSILPFRETQVARIAENMESAADGGSGQNTFIFGPPGIGKTATVRFVFRQFEDEYPGIRAVYVNCWDCNTSIAVMSKITNDLGVFVPRRGLGKDEVSGKFQEAVGKSKGGVVVCLDEVDQLVNKEPGALYSLIRLGGPRQLTLVMISNDPHIMSKLENRVTSSLSAEEVEFRSYNIDEMKGILSERARTAFSSFESAAIMLAANHAIRKGGDVRVGLQCLQRAGRVAEKVGDSRLLAKHVRDVVSVVKEAKPQIVMKKLNAHEKSIVEIVAKKSPMSFGELFAAYRKSVEKPSSERMVQEYVRHLEQAKMIRLSEKKVAGKRMVYAV
ncbi:MAG: AAA family ATPase [Candidatus Aenigmarchaeota archaeon]|nr:AAA family ATPase [Candidatus Aenigmarchaeota archaeon]